MLTLNIRTALLAAFAIALFSAGAFAAGNAARTIAPATDAKTCAQLVSDTREMLEETEVSEDTDRMIETLIGEAVAQCDAGLFDRATESVVQARTLLTRE